MAETPLCPQCCWTRRTSSVRICKVISTLQFCLLLTVSFQVKECNWRCCVDSLFRALNLCHLLIQVAIWCHWLRFLSMGVLNTLLLSVSGLDSCISNVSGNRLREDQFRRIWAQHLLFSRSFLTYTQNQMEGYRRIICKLRRPKPIYLLQIHKIVLGSSLGPYSEVFLCLSTFLKFCDFCRIFSYWYQNQSILFSPRPRYKGCCQVWCRDDKCLHCEGKEWYW